MDGAYVCVLALEDNRVLGAVTIAAYNTGSLIMMLQLNTKD